MERSVDRDSCARTLCGCNDHELGITRRVACCVQAGDRRALVGVRRKCAFARQTTPQCDGQ